MATAEKRIKRPKKRVLEAIREGLNEIEAYFELSGFSGTAPTKIESDEGAIRGNLDSNEGDEEAVSEDDEDLDDYADLDDYTDLDLSGGVEREDIEVAIDEFISELKEAGLLPKVAAQKAPTLEEVFSKYFGADHEVTQTAKQFEEFVKGYFGFVTWDDMRAAHEKFVKIQRLLKEEAERDQNGNQ